MFETLVKEYSMQKNLDTLKDEELVVLANAGNADAEELVFSRYKNTVKSKARTYYLIGADNDDIVQEGMIGLYKAVRDFNKDKNITFKTFADVCITRQILTAIRTANRYKHSPLNAYVSMNAPVFGEDSNTTVSNLFKEDAASNPEELYILDETIRELKQLIYKKLSNFEKEVLELYLEGCSYNDISEKMQKSPKSIDNALQRIKKKLTGYSFGN